MIIPAQNIKNIMDEWFLKVLRAVQKLHLKLTNTPRPSSYPYISGDSFRALADFVHDETGTFNPKNVNRGDIVFVGNNFMKEYFLTVHKSIENPYILIQHNGDNVVDEEMASLIDEKIIRFYAQNTTVNHSKIIPLPLGATNKYWYAGGMPWTYTRKPKKNKLPRILFSFTIYTNPQERKPALAYFLTHPCMDKPEKFLPANAHTKLLNNYSFVISPPGNGPETHRTWEGLYMKTIPITKPFVGINYFKNLGLPIWILDDWTELELFSEKELQTKYTNMMEKANFSALYMDYWIELIKKDQLNTSK